MVDQITLLHEHARERTSERDNLPTPPSIAFLLAYPSSK